jgi:Domain of unknown function (DUF4124)/Penicillin-Binding Protein C-terminus Family
MAAERPVSGRSVLLCGSRPLGYARSVRYFLLLASLCTVAAFGARIYQWTAPDGSIMFSDQPHPGAKKLEVPAVPTYKPPPVPTHAHGPAEAPPKAAREEHVYQRLQIAEPAAGATIFSDRDTVSVDLSVTPPLDTSAGDRVVAILDGTPLGTTFAGPAFEIPSVHRGTHSLTVRIEDADGRTLIESSPVTFEMKHHSLLSPGTPASDQDRGFHTQPQSRIQQPAR